MQTIQGGNISTVSMKDFTVVGKKVNNDWLSENLHNMWLKTIYNRASGQVYTYETIQTNCMLSLAQKCPDLSGAMLPLS